MKRILLFCLLFFFATTLLCVAQENQDVVYLKNGTIVRGTIIEFVPDEYVDISMPNGRVRSFGMKDVERIVNERSRPESRTARPAQNNARSQQNNYRPSQYNERYAPNYNDRYSQNDNRNSRKRKKFYVTPKVGINKAYRTAHDRTAKVGIDIGCALEWALTPRFTLESGLLYSNHRYIQDFNYYENGKWEIEQHQMNQNIFYFPLLAKFFIYRGINIFAGPQLGAGYKKVGDYSDNINLKTEKWGYISNDLVVFPSVYGGIGYLFNNGFSVSVGFSRTVQAHIGWSF